jgi:hypothetical protein
MPQFKKLLREDHNRTSFDSHVDGDYLNFVDTYSFFIDEIGNIAKSMSEKAVLNERYMNRADFAKHVTSGVHDYVMKQLYRNIFERMNPSQRDIDVNKVFTENAPFLMKQATEKLKEVLKVDEY